jgi:hypothetical protein
MMIGQMIGAFGADDVAGSRPTFRKLRFHVIAHSSGVAVEELRGIPYVWHERRSETDFPTREEFITIAPAVVETKARYGLDWFDGRWCALQLHLF